MTKIQPQPKANDHAFYPRNQVSSATSLNAHRRPNSLNAEPAKLLEHWLRERLSKDDYAWLDNQTHKILRANSERDLHITLGLIPRKFGRADLQLPSTDLQAANSAIAGWNPAHWSIDVAARLLVLCKLAAHDNDLFAETIVDLCQSADLTESITLYSGSMLYPRSPQLDAQIGQGLRTNIRAVFEAIAHRNPYPATYFDQHRWNHMVLKALFIDSTLAPIVGLDNRANSELAGIMCDYAHERWAAGRPVTPELWRCVGPFAQGSALDDLEKVIQSDMLAERQAGMLALSASPDPAAKKLMQQFPTVSHTIANGTLSWDALPV